MLLVCFFFLFTSHQFRAAYLIFSLLSCHITLKHSLFLQFSFVFCFLTNRWVDTCLLATPESLIVREGATESAERRWTTWCATDHRQPSLSSSSQMHARNSSSTNNTNITRNTCTVASERNNTTLHNSPFKKDQTLGMNDKNMCMVGYSRKWNVDTAKFDRTYSYLHDEMELLFLSLFQFSARRWMQKSNTHTQYECERERWLRTSRIHVLVCRSRLLYLQRTENRVADGGEEVNVCYRRTGMNHDRVNILNSISNSNHQRKTFTTIRIDRVDRYIQ